MSILTTNASNILIMRLSSLLLFFTMMCMGLILPSCEQEAIIPVSDHTSSNQFEPGTNIRLNKTQMDALLIAEFGYVESDAERKFEQLIELVNIKLGLSGKEQNFDQKVNHPCLLNLRNDIPSSSGQFTRGTLCADTDLILTNFIFFRTTMGEGAEADTDIFMVAFENTEISLAGTTFTDGRTVLFAGLSANISKPITPDGLNAEVIIGRSVARTNISCSTGEDLRIRSQTQATNRGSAFDEEEVSFTINLDISCRD